MQGAANQWLLRNVMSFGSDGSMACSGDLTEGAFLQLMIGSRELALDAARRAAREALRPMARPAGVLVFDSVVRRRLLGSHHAALEIARIRETIGTGTPFAGCYTYGEQAALGAGDAASASTQTGTVLVVALGT
jgi:hypothetical protein